MVLLTAGKVLLGIRRTTHTHRHRHPPRLVTALQVELASCKDQKSLASRHNSLRKQVFAVPVLAELFLYQEVCTNFIAFKIKFNFLIWPCITGFVVGYSCTLTPRSSSSPWAREDITS